MASPTKKPKLLSFLKSKLEDSLHLEGLNSSLAQSAGELQSCQMTFEALFIQTVLAAKVSTWSVYDYESAIMLQRHLFVCSCVGCCWCSGCCLSLSFLSIIPATSGHWWKWWKPDQVGTVIIIICQIIQIRELVYVEFKFI